MLFRSLRHPIWSPDDCLVQRAKLETIIGKKAANNLAVKAKQVALDPTHGMIEVDSAFGGLGIYKRKAFFIFHIFYFNYYLSFVKRNSV